MRLELEYFHWRCALDGYDWREVPTLPLVIKSSEKTEIMRQRLLLPKPPGVKARMYYPLLNHPTLFKEFAALSPTQESFVQFANTYGFLGVPAPMVAETGPLMGGEPFDTWLEEWRKMRNVVFVINKIESKDQAQLEECIIDRGTHASLDMQIDGRLQMVAHICDPKNLRPWLWNHALEAPTQVERLTRFAKGWLQDAINKSLSSKDAVPAQILFNDVKNDFHLHVVPQSLLAAMWLQCARFVTLNTEFRACLHCGKWFELSPDAKRRNSKYCEPRCKVAAFRAKQSRAAKPSSDQTRLA